MAEFLDPKNPYPPIFSSIGGRLEGVELTKENCSLKSSGPEAAGAPQSGGHVRGAIPYERARGFRKLLAESPPSYIGKRARHVILFPRSQREVSGADFSQERHSVTRFSI